MRALAFLLLAQVVHNERSTTLHDEIGMVTVRTLPQPLAFWAYLQVELDDAQEGVPVAIRFEFEREGGGAAEANAVFAFDLIGPMTDPYGLPAIFRIYQQIGWLAKEQGIYRVLAYVDDVLVTERPLLVRIANTRVATEQQRGE